MKEQRPNILLIVTDQQRYDSLSCYGLKALHTSNLDNLAEKGVVFENCYVNNTICTPNRASIFTGRHLPGHGVYKLHDILPDDQFLFTKKLKELEYRTALFGKLHVSGHLCEEVRRHPNDGFDVYEWCMEPSLSMDSPFNGYTKWLKKKDLKFYEKLKKEKRELLHIPRELHMTHWAAERTIDYIQRCDGKNPFFCMISVFDPHNPYEDYPIEMLELLDKDNIPDPLIVEDEMKNKPLGIRQEHEHSYLGAFKNYTFKQLRKMRLGYYASIALIDLEVGRVLNVLKEKGIEENTLVIFTSDHGDMLGDHQLLAKGAIFFDPCVKVPLIMRWPQKIVSGKRIKQLVQSHDLAATILAAAGFPNKEREKSMPESKDLIPLAIGRREKIHDFAICCYRNSGINDERAYWDPEIHATMIRDEQYKLNVYHNVSEYRICFQGELYDMERDRNELNDIWDDPQYRDVRIRMTEQLLDWVVGQELRLGSRGGEAVN